MKEETTREEIFLNNAEDIIKNSLHENEDFQNLSEAEQEKLEWIVTKSLYIHREKLMEDADEYFENFKLLEKI
jgi:hypothetical protein